MNPLSLAGRLFHSFHNPPGAPCLMYFENPPVLVPTEELDGPGVDWNRCHFDGYGREEPILYFRQGDDGGVRLKMDDLYICDRGTFTIRHLLHRRYLRLYRKVFRKDTSIFDEPGGWA